MDEIHVQDNLISLLEMETDISRGLKLQIPQQCTTSNAGPLKLQSSKSSLAYQNNDRHSLCSNPLPKLQRRKHIQQTFRSLNRFPVFLVRRPMEEAKDGISGMSSIEFMENVEQLKVSTL